MAPVAVFSEKPVGKAPAEILQVKGPWPPVNTIVWLEFAPTMPLGKVVVVMDGAGGRLTAMLSGCEPDCAGLLESVTLMVKLDVLFGPVGAPVIAPVLLFRLRPGGRVPTLTE